MVVLSILVVALILPRLNDTRTASVIVRKTPAVESRPLTALRRAPAARVATTPPQQKTDMPRPLPTRPNVPPTAARTARPLTVPLTGPLTGPRAAIVIDDLGQSLSHFEQIAALNIPLTIAVIPGLPATARTVSEASRRGIEMLLHQPMEPREESGKNPGEGVLLTSMSAETLRGRVRASLAAVPGAVGVNNHMGSRFTEDAAGLGALMAEIKEHGLFWLDSRTTPGTRGVEAAHAAGVPALERDIFIDAEVNVEGIRRQVRKLIETARDRGSAVGIGHPHPETIAVLRELRAELLASGVTLVPVSSLLHGNRTPGPGTTLAAAVAVKGTAGEQTAKGKAATP